MYHLINTYIGAVLDGIQAVHVTEYDWLIENMNHCATPEYRTRYSYYWRLNAARLCENYRNVYFQTLQAQHQNVLAGGPLPAVDHLTMQLYNTPTNLNGGQRLQFSFATKLVHMVQSTKPIYDSRISTYYFFQTPKSQLLPAERIWTLTAFYEFLTEEYERILQNNLLAASIQHFRNHFNPQHFSDQKVIDSLLWAYVIKLQAGGIITGTIIYC